MNEETNKLLREILHWQKIIGINYLKKSAKNILDSQKKREIFELTGKFGQKEIKEKLKVSPNTISDVWVQCSSSGLLIPEGKSYRKLLTLKELGLKIKVD